MGTHRSVLPVSQESDLPLSNSRFTVDTWQDRISRAQEEMRKQQVRALILGPGADLIYLTGFHAHVSERMNLLVLPQEGKPAFVTPLFEAPLLGDDPSALVDLHTWSDGEDPATIAAGLIGDANPIAVGDALASVFLIRLQSQISATWQEASPLMRELRMIKDDAEISALQEAASKTDEAWAEFIDSVTLTGLTELEALKILTDLTAKRGIVNIWGICGSGPNSASPHHNAGDRKIQPGDAVVFDWGGQIDGYFSDMTRTVHVGPPSEEFVTCYETVLQANQAALDAMVPGTPLEQIDIAAREVIESAGYGEYFLHRLGHGLGLEVHEDPYVVRGNTLPLAPGMVFSDEPGIYLAEKFGIRIEDIVVATPEGGRRLNHADRTLRIVQ